MREPGAGVNPGRRHNASAPLARSTSELSEKPLAGVSVTRSASSASVISAGDSIVADVPSG